MKETKNIHNSKTQTNKIMKRLTTVVVLGIILTASQAFAQSPSIDNFIHTFKNEKDATHVTLGSFIFNLVSFVAKFDDSGDWEESKYTGYWRLKLAPQAMLRNEILAYEKVRREKIHSWLAVLTGIIGALTGLIGVLIGLISVWPNS